MSSSLLLKQCPECPVRLALIVFVSGGDCTAAALWDATSMTSSILLATFMCSCRHAFFPIRFVSAHVANPYSSIDTTAAWKKLHFLLSVSSDFHMTDS